MTDRAFEDLQKRCKMMSIKSFAKIILYIFIFFLILIFIYVVYMKITASTFKKSKVLQKQAKIVKEIAPKVIPAIKKSPVPKVIPKIKTKKISQKDDYDTVFLKPTIVIPEIKVLQNKQMVLPKASVIKEKKIEKTVVKPKKKFLIQVRSLENKASLLKDDKTSENFDTTLKLSIYYFKKSKFEKAIKWSKKANHYKPSSFEPWLIYAKAKIKQGKKEEAIKAVETFLSYFSSQEAENFLYKIKSRK